jgi:small subunit ribosomal protein S9
MNLETTKLYGIGRRKESIAQVLLTAGNGQIKINNKNAQEYLQNNQNYILKINQPLIVLGLVDSFDIKVKTKGGGLTGQTDSICLAIARALSQNESSNRVDLKNEGLLTRDARIKERKKYGLKKARKASQFSKR